MKFTRESWESFNTYCDEILHKFSDEIENLKSQYDDVKFIFTDEVINEFKSDLIATIKSILKNKQGFIFEYLIENFKRSFELNPTGQVHMWRHLQDSEINDLFKKSKLEFAPILKTFDKPVLLNFDNEIVLNIDDCQKLKKRFETDTNNILEEVFNKKYNRNSLQKVPKWLWFVLAYFMHDNVLEWMRNPLFFVFITAILSTVGYIYFTNKMDYIVNWWDYLKAFAIKKMLDATMNANSSNQRSSNQEDMNTSLYGRDTSLGQNGSQVQSKDSSILKETK
jgi:hypothetical protein